MTRLPRPDITRDGEALRSDRFGDIYYQEADGLAETAHVFLGGNDLPARFAAHHGARPFIIGELGFGTGLNILATAKLFEEMAPPDARLSIWTAEGFPFAPEDLRDILGAIAARWPDIGPWASRLGAVYPRPRPGQRQIDLTDRIRLTFGFGPAAEVLGDAGFKADAWFLDGFSPAQNPEMWSEELMGLVATHTRPGGSFATFTVAGAVRLALETAGFAIEKRPGFGRKREMLAGRIPPDEAEESSIRKVTIIGAGIAGAAAAHMARTAGLDATLIEAVAPASGASGNPAGLLMPRIEAQDNPAARFYRDAFLLARRFYEECVPGALLSSGGVMIDRPERLTGVLATGLWDGHDLAFEGDRLLAARAAVLHPAGIVRELIGDLPIRQCQVTAIRENEGAIHLETDEGSFDTEAVIVAAGPGSARLLGFEEDMSASRGQVDVFAGPVPSRILTDGTYIAPCRGQLIAGATYDPPEPGATVMPEPQSSAANREAATTLLGEPAGEWVSARASLRATTRDRHPIAGAINEQSRILALTGLGSRGLVTAPILARHLITELMGDISPLTRSESGFVAPARFEERRRRRAQSSATG